MSLGDKYLLYWPLDIKEEYSYSHVVVEAVHMLAVYGVLSYRLYGFNCSNDVSFSGWQFGASDVLKLSGP